MYLLLHEFRKAEVKAAIYDIYADHRQIIFFTRINEDWKLVTWNERPYTIEKQIYLVPFKKKKKVYLFVKGFL